MRNLGLKLIAVLLAFGVWFIASAPRRERVSERRFAAPLSLVGMPREFVITTPVAENVSVRLRGRVSDLRSLSSQSLEVPVDLSWVQQAGEARITLRPNAISVPPEIEVVSIEPNILRFRVEQLRQGTVPIRPFLLGQPAAGYVVGEPTAQPDAALVSGPSSQVRSLSEVGTERINMTSHTQTFVQNVAVVSDLPLVRVISPLTTQVTVPVMPAIGPAPPPAVTTTDAAAKSPAAESDKDGHPPR